MSDNDDAQGMKIRQQEATRRRQESERVAAAMRAEAQRGRRAEKERRRMEETERRRQEEL